MTDLVVAVAARVDALEGSIERRASELEGLKQDVAALGRGMARLLSAKQEEKGQPDWINVDTSAEAVAMLRKAARFHDRHLPWLDAALPPCWPWHPVLVVEVVGLGEQYPESYKSGRAADVSDFLGRWLTGFRNRTKKALGECNRSEHHEDGRVYAVDVGQLDRLAEWWALDRRGLPPGLTER